jgi:hypothetical protein
MIQRGKNERVLISFDYAIRLFLRNRISFEILEGFLSELLKFDVSIKSIRKSECTDKRRTREFNIVDIFAADETGDIIFIELLYMTEYDFQYYTLFGKRKTMKERIIMTPEYKNDVKRIYSINIMLFDFGEGEDYIYHSEINFTGLYMKDELQVSSPKCLTTGLDLGRLSPEYYILKVNNFEDEVEDTLDEWIYFLKNNVVKDEFKAKGLEKASEVFDINNLTPEEREEYNRLSDIRASESDALAEIAKLK